MKKYFSKLFLTKQNESIMFSQKFVFNSLNSDFAFAKFLLDKFRFFPKNSLAGLKKLWFFPNFELQAGGELSSLTPARRTYQYNIS